MAYFARPDTTIGTHGNDCHGKAFTTSIVFRPDNGSHYGVGASRKGLPVSGALSYNRPNAFPGIGTASGRQWRNHGTWNVQNHSSRSASRAIYSRRGNDSVEVSAVPVYILQDGSTYIYKFNGDIINAGNLEFAKTQKEENFISPSKT